METAWIALSLQPHIGIKTLRSLQAHFDQDLLAALNADTKALRRVPGIGILTANSIKSINLAQVEAQIARWKALGVTCVPYGHPAYPPLLVGLDDAPATLFVRGMLDQSRWHKTAALVGTRTPSPAANQSAFELAAALAKAGFTIVSGLAVGIDAAAHAGALAAPEGYTLGVMGCGVLNPYPRDNLPLAERILHRGAILSEVPPDSGVNAARLVARNRIISGLSQHVIVVETEVDGGAMYAARAAVAAGRCLYTLDLRTSGNQDLIANGAQVIDASYPMLHSPA